MIWRFRGLDNFAGYIGIAAILGTA